jgi:hypothetical protein
MESGGTGIPTPLRFSWIGIAWRKLTNPTFLSGVDIGLARYFVEINKRPSCFLPTLGSFCVYSLPGSIDRPGAVVLFGGRRSIERRRG